MKLLAVLDFGHDTARVLMAQKEGRTFRVRGFGQSPAEGVENGEVVCLGDAVESVVEAAAMASRSAGARIHTLYYNLDDACLQSLEVRESKPLGGEGQIRQSDVDAMRRSAEKLGGDFDQRIVYCKETHFLVDDRDFLTQAVGVFGRKLDLFAHVILARAAHCEAWSCMMERAAMPKSVAIVSPWSTAYGTLAPEERAAKRLILDAGSDLMNVFIFENNRIKKAAAAFAAGGTDAERVSSMAEKTRALLQPETGIQEILLTGDWASDGLARALTEAFSIPCRMVPARLAGFEEPRHASLAGLLWVAAECEARRPVFQYEKGWAAAAKQKAAAFLDEYF